MPCVSSPRGKTAAAPTGRQDCSFGQWHKGRVLESDSGRAWTPQGELPRSSTPAHAEPTAAPHHCSLLQLLTPDPAWSAQCNTRHLILEAAGGCEKLSLQSETVLTYWKISFSSKLCMFVPVLCSLPGFLFFRSTAPPFSSGWPASQQALPYLLLPLMNLAIILWNPPCCKQLSPTWWVVSPLAEEKMLEDNLYKGIIPQSILSNSKTLPKPSIFQPLSCPKVACANPLRLMKPGKKSMECCKD